jgi:PmbA protein
MERDYDHSSALHGEDLEAPDAIGRSAGERAVRRLNPRKVKTQAVPVIFDARLSSTLISHLASAANGVSIARKASFVKDKLGERLFAPGIRIVDDPLRRRGLRSHPFDGEGVAVQKMDFVADGILKSWFLDSATARELGLQTTGHAARGVSAPPSPVPSNLYLEPGAITPEQLIAETGTGFYITDLIGMGTNLVTGDYSRGAAGFWIEDGEPTYPVSEVTVAGHLLDMFRTLTPANDLSFKFVTNAPTLRVEGLTVAGH